MKLDDLPPQAISADGEHDLLAPLLRGDVDAQGVSPAPVHGALVGQLIAIVDAGRQPLVRYPGQTGSAALRARATVDLHGPHIGAQVLLVFDRGDPGLPIVIGVLREHAGWPLPDAPAQVEVDADGERLIVNAREQLVLRCGKASIRLTKSGRIEVKGETIISQAAGAHRIRGGSVQLN